MNTDLQKSMSLLAGDPVVQLDESGEAFYLVGPAVLPRLHTGPQPSSFKKEIVFQVYFLTSHTQSNLQKSIYEK
jgi:hypothetical protein